MENAYYVYIMTNPTQTVLYVGFSSRLLYRVQEHREKLVAGFTAKYNCIKLVYYQCFEDRNAALAREKEIKKWSRVKKELLIATMNPEWKNLYINLMRAEYEDLS